MTVFQKGAVYNYLTVLNSKPDKSKNGKIKCKCVCDNIHYTVKYNLVHEKVKSCGCKINQLISKKKCKYPWMTKELYHCFYNMRSRCYDKDHRQYKRYGARNIDICTEWLEGGASVFGKWAVDNGWKKGLHLDRRKNNKGYSPNNCRWVTQKINNQNRSNTLKVKYNDKTYVVSEFLKMHGSKVDWRTFQNRIKKGVNPIKAATIKDMRIKSTFYYAKGAFKRRQIKRLKTQRNQLTDFPVCFPPAKAKYIVKKDQMFGHWKVLHETLPKEYNLPNGKVNRVRKIACLCTACNVTQAAPVLSDLKGGKSKHCGCLQAEQARQANTTHGFRNHPLRKVHRNMLDRCFNPKNTHYASYGGRGILPCKEWGNKGLENFVNWGMSNGYKPGLHLDRKNNNKGYTPKNCRFVTPTKNANNKSSNLYVNYKGTKYSFKEFYDKYNNGVSYMTALVRHKDFNYPPMQAVINSYDL